MRRTIAVERNLRWALGVGVVFGAMCTAACGELTVRATDGRILPDMVSAVRASAAHDIGCAFEQVDVKNISENDVHELIAEGCGSRATYRVVPGSSFAGWEAVQVSRFPSGPGGRPPSP
jgi:hypothetical protein